MRNPANNVSTQPLSVLFPGRSSAALAAGLAGCLMLSSPSLQAQDQNQTQTQNQTQNQTKGQPECGPLPSHQTLSQALKEIVTPGDTDTNGGLGNHMWATVVDRSGAICAVVYSGESFGQQWPGSRGISAEKAFTANAYSLSGFALSSANLFWPSKPGNSLYGLELGNPVHEEALYQGPASAWGRPDDPLVNQRIGGTIVFAGGLALYNADGDLVGALGLSGDQSCTDHIIAWKVRHHLNLDNVPAGVSKAGNDNIIFDLTVDPASGREKSASGYGHPSCGPTAKEIANNLGEKFPTGPEE